MKLMTRDKEFYKQFFALYWVLVLHNVIILGVNLADNIMIGSYSETSLAGTPFFTLAIVTPPLT